MTDTTGLRGLDLLDAAIAHIEAHPETWEQGAWRCKTGMCLAGWTAELAGGQWLAEPGHRAAHLLAAEPDDPPGHVIPTTTGRDGIPVAARAERLLGARVVPGWWRECPDGHNEEGDLFAADNTLADIKGMRDVLRKRQP